MKAAYPVAYYSHATNKTEAVQFNLNCKLFLVYMGAVRAPVSCEGLLTSRIPLAGEATSKSELIIFITVKCSSICMNSAVLLEEDVDYIGGGVFHVRTNILFFRVTAEPVGDVARAAVKYNIQTVYKFKLFCPYSWACFVKVDLDLGRDKINFHLWEVIFYLRINPVYSKNDLREIASAPLHKLRMGIGSEPAKALDAPFMKIAIVMAIKYNFTPVAVNRRKHSRPSAPFKYSTMENRRAFVSTAKVIRSLSVGSTLLTAVSPVVRTFLYCQQRKKWAAKSSGDALAFINRFDGWTWLWIVVQGAIISFINVKLFRQQSSIVMLIAPLVWQGLGNLLRTKKKGSIVMPVLWALGSIFLSAAYMARFESSLVAPQRLESIHTFKDLIGQDYRILAKYQTRTYVMLMDFPEVNAFSSLPHLRKLKETAKVVPNSEFGMHMHLVKNPKRALLDEQKLLEEFRVLLDEFFPALECFVGGENLFVYPRFWAFFYLYSHELQGTFERIVESGIYKVMNEIYERQEMDVEMLVRENYVEQFGHPEGAQQTQSALSTLSLFSMENPQANIVFKSCLILVGVAVATLIFELAVRALSCPRNLSPVRCGCVELAFD